MRLMSRVSMTLASIFIVLSKPDLHPPLERFGQPLVDDPLDLIGVEKWEAPKPLHRWRFNLRTGRCTTALDRSLHKFRCEVREGRV